MKALAEDILRVLVDRLGMQSVRTILETLEIAETGRSRLPKRPSSRKPRKRATPTEVVQRAKPRRRIKGELTELARMYEGKAFLPTISDVRHFLYSRGLEVDTLKNREAAFPKVLKMMLAMPDHAIRELRNSSVHSGPMSLAPIAEAITAVGEARIAEGSRAIGS